MRSMKIKMAFAKAMSHLPKPVAMFILDRIFVPLTIMIAASCFGLVIAITMLLVFVVAPFDPKFSRQLWDKVTDGFKA